MAASDGKLRVTFSAVAVLRALGALAVLLVALSVGARWLKHRYGCEGLECTVVKAIDVDQEANLPTWYSACILLSAGVLSGVAARAARAGGQQDVTRWTALGAVFTAASLDEIATIHEHVSALLRAKANLGGLLHNAWVIPAAAFMLAFGVWMLPFLRRLPSRTRRLFLVAGAVFVSGGVGVEVIDGALGQRFGEDSFLYAVLTGVEELGEMLGITLVIYTLLDHLGANGVSLEVGRAPAAEGASAEVADRAAPAVLP